MLEVRNSFAEQRRVIGNLADDNVATSAKQPTDSSRGMVMVYRHDHRTIGARAATGIVFTTDGTPTTLGGQHVGVIPKREIVLTFEICSAFLIGIGAVTFSHVFAMALTAFGILVVLTLVSALLLGVVLSPFHLVGRLGDLLLLNPSRVLRGRSTGPVLVPLFESRADWNLGTASASAVVGVHAYRLPQDSEKV